MKTYGLLLCCFLALISFSASAQNAPVTTAASVTAGGPGQISIPVTVVNFINVGAISLSLDYDYSVLQFQTGIPHSSLSSFIFNDKAIAGGKHRVVMSWFGVGTSLENESIIITMQFNYISGSSSLTWYDNGLSCEYADGNGEVLNDIPKSTYYRNGSVSQVYAIYGNVSYYKPAGPNLPLNDLELWLIKDEEHIATSVTSPNGAYEFSSLDNGTYTIVVHQNNKPVGGINATDAGLLNWWSSHPSDIEQVKFLAGDVQNDYWIQSTDAYKVQQYFVYGIPFERTTETGTPWTYWQSGGLLIHSNMNPYNGISEWPVSMEVTVNGGNVALDILGLCIGDYNGSFTPGSAKSFSTSVFIEEGTVFLAGAGQEVDIPVKVTRACETSAVSLILNFPAELAAVTGVNMSHATEPVSWVVTGNELRIGWNTTNPISLNAGDVFFTINLRTKNEFVSGNAIRFSLHEDPLNEIAGKNYEPLQGESLLFGTVMASPIGISENDGINCILFENFPNPFEHFTELRYFIPSDGKVNLEINDISGKSVKTMLNDHESKGKHSLKLEAYSLQPGFYTAILTLVSGNTRLSRTIKLIKSE